MPKTPIDYSKIVIYKIVCNDLNIKDVYVGSTTDFRRRKNQHKSYCNNENTRQYNYKIYQIIRANGRWCNWTMVEIEKYTPCLDGNQARARERYWLELLNASMNIQVPGRTEKEWIEDNKDKIALQQKEYNEEYYKANKDKIKEQSKEYYQNNKDKINEQRRELRKLKKQDQKQ